MEGFIKSNRIGKGAFGVVYLFKHEGNGAVCAGKKVKCVSDKEMQMVLREMLCMAKVEHKNVVQIKDVAVSIQKERNVLWLYTEYCNEGNLNDFIQKEDRMENTPMKLHLMRQVAGALNFLHSKKIVHRDLKPTNILVTTEGEEIIAKVGDFGVSKMHDTLRSMMCTKVGTEFFMSPEVYARKSYNDKCDVFSLGVVFLALLAKSVVSGFVVYAEGKSGEPLCIYLERAKKLPKSVEDKMKQHPNLQKVVIAMLAFEPKKRPSAAEVLTSLFSITKRFTAEEKMASCITTTSSPPHHQTTLDDDSDDSSDDEEVPGYSITKMKTEIIKKSSTKVKPKPKMHTFSPAAPPSKASGSSDGASITDSAKSTSTESLDSLSEDELVRMFLDMAGFTKK